MRDCVCMRQDLLLIYVVGLPFIYVNVELDLINWQYEAVTCCFRNYFVDHLWLCFIFTGAESVDNHS